MVKDVGVHVQAQVRAPNQIEDHRLVRQRHRLLLDQAPCAQGERVPGDAADVLRVEKGDGDLRLVGPGGQQGQETQENRRSGTPVVRSRNGPSTFHGLRFPVGLQTGVEVGTQEHGPGL
jgi:hypothetical protein